MHATERQPATIVDAILFPNLLAVLIKPSLLLMGPNTYWPFDATKFVKGNKHADHGAIQAKLRRVTA